LTYVLPLILLDKPRGASKEGLGLRKKKFKNKKI
jgi:hypothetical protein